MEAAAGGASDVEEAAFWWSNCVQLRWMLWAMSHAAPELELHTDDAGHPADDFDWVMQVCRSVTVFFPVWLALTAASRQDWHTSVGRSGHAPMPPPRMSKACI
jgi:hypothetical protein